MLRHELENMCGVVSDADFELINLVYTFHPSIDDVKGKQQIAELYNNFGMRIIFDMITTAKRAQSLEELIRVRQTEIEDLKRSLIELGKGE